MSRGIIVELTDRCNLACGHCLPLRHGGATDLAMEDLGQLWREAPALGFDRISYTGGEPTMHPRFADVLRGTAAAGIRFGIVTNGWSFPSIYPRLLEHSRHLVGVTFSMDGASAATHDRLRGQGSFLRLMKAFSVCAATGLPFTVNMVLTAENRHEVRDAAQLAQQLGARGIRFGHLMPSADSIARGLLLDAAERDAADAAIGALRAEMTMPVAKAPGHRTADLFPCEPLQMRELNVDCHGRVSKCCHLSGYREGSGDRGGRLGEAGFAELVGRLDQDNRRFRLEKEHRRAAGLLSATGHWPCLYCAQEYGKLSGLVRIETGAGH